MIDLRLGDCLEVMPALEANSVDTIITDPPYGLSFMGKDWDHGVPGAHFWEAALRVAKPGAFLLAFGGTRTHHRLACAIEDAGWEIRDTIMWVYGQGFPKSLDQSKAIQGLFLREFLEDVRRLKNTSGDYQVNCSDNCRQCGVPLHAVLEDGQGLSQSPAVAPLHSHPCEPLIETQKGNGHKCTASCVGLSDHLSKMGSRSHRDGDAWQLIREVASCLCLPCFVQSIADVSPHAIHQGGIDWSNIDALSVVTAWGISRTFFHKMHILSQPYNHYITAIEKFEGYGSALKPAHEPIIVAMKPIETTFAENALEWGVAGLNIDGARIPTNDDYGRSAARADGFVNKGEYFSGLQSGDLADYASPAGRWPANVILDEEAGRLLDEQSGERKSGGQGNIDRVRTVSYALNDFLGVDNSHHFGDTGGASRFFYCAKSSRSERDAGLEGMPEGLSRRTGISDPKWREGRGRKAQELHERNIHPTVKPLALMRYLCTLTMTPTGGVVLDPFMGSGSTGIAAKQTGRDFIGIEISPEYYEIAQKRIEWAQSQAIQIPMELSV